MGLKIVIVRFLLIAVIYALVIAIGGMGSARADDRTKMRDAFNIEPGIGYSTVDSRTITAEKIFGERGLLDLNKYYLSILNVFLH